MEPGTHWRLLSLRPEMAAALEHTRTLTLTSTHSANITNSRDTRDTLALVSSNVNTSRLCSIPFTKNVELRESNYDALRRILENYVNLRYIVLPEAHRLWTE